MDIEHNRRLWTRYPWTLDGDEWSGEWGGPEYQWHGTLYPRIAMFVPTGTLLEIGTGYGRWTAYLLPLCERLIGIDLTPNCVERCNERFANAEHASFHVNDGRSLEAVPDGTVDFAFSFDSLPHAEADALEAYVHELARTLAPAGVAWIHHSNLKPLLDPATGEPPFPNRGARGKTMSAELFQRFCDDAGLACIGQELIGWHVEPLSDCFSLVTRPDSTLARPKRTWENHGFNEEAAHLAELAAFYGPLGFMRAEAAEAESGG